MIISASRRTDIPAFYSKWFFNRVRSGYCVTKNPYNPSQVYRVSLKPEDVDVFVFWSKNPEPMMPFLPMLDDSGYRYYFLFTLNDYPKELEANIPPLKARLGTFKKLSSMLGRERVIWRYDPIVISNKTAWDYHRIKFAELSRELEGSTERVMVSLVEYYRKTLSNLAKLEPGKYEFDTGAAGKAETDSLLRSMAETASMRGMEIFSCASGADYGDAGVKAGRCIDAELINGLWDINVSQKKDPGQRKFCKCAVSRDIGANDTCIHDCPYCYATKNHPLAIERYSNHDPESEYLV